MCNRHCFELENVWRFDAMSGRGGGDGDGGHTRKRRPEQSDIWKKPLGVGLFVVFRGFHHEKHGLERVAWKCISLGFSLSTFGVSYRTWN